MSLYDELKLILKLLKGRNKVKPAEDKRMKLSKQ